MKRLACAVLFALAAPGTCQAVDIAINGVIYSNVVVSREYPKSVFISFDGGTRFLEKKYLSASNAVALGIADSIQLAEYERVVGEERYKQERAAFEAAQEAKGLVKDGDQWIAKEELAAREKRQKEEAANRERRQKIANVVDGKSINIGPWAKLRVIQPLSDGCLVVGTPEHLFNDEVVFWIDGSDAIFADQDVVVVRELYWAGTYNYTTVENVDKVIHCYSTNRTRAIDLLANRLDESEKASQSEPRSRAVTATSGSGFFITSDGYFVTNHHVVEDAKRLKVHTRGGSFDATLVRFDANNDLAVLKVEKDVKPLRLADPKSVRQGSKVFVVGFPMPDIQGVSPKVTSGVVNALSGLQDDVTMIQIDAAVQPGNSGGPVIDETGRVVGVVAARVNDMAAIKRGAIAQNVNYAVKVSYLSALLDSIPDLATSLPASDASSSVDSVESAVDASGLVEALQD